jgi:hypothetical protein
MSINGFADLLGLREWPRQLDIAQTTTAWSQDEQWMSMRDEIDGLLFSRFIQAEKIIVRRLVFLEPPLGVDSVVADEHRRWVAGLVRDLYHLDMPERGKDAPYRVRQLIRDPDPVQSPRLDDGWSGDQNGPWSQAFEALWSALGSIENNVLPPDFPVGPVADRDPRWYLWH